MDKNPTPMIDRLDELKDYMYYFQFTVNPYGKEIEENVPSKNNIIIPSFRELSRIIGPERIIWRYDPIILSRKYSIDYHITYFNEIAKRLSGYTNKCIISFLDIYRNTKLNMKNLELLPISENEIFALSQRLVDIAHKIIL